jgi:hypothetical protein
MSYFPGAKRLLKLDYNRNENFWNGFFFWKYKKFLLCIR